MTPIRFLVALLLVAQVVFATSAAADCVLPKAPGPAPNGSAASAAEMEAARATLERYRKAVKEYLTCTEQEVKTRVTALGDKAEMIRQVRLFADKRTKSLQEELQTHVDEFDDQLRAFKLNNRD